MKLRICEEIKVQNAPEELYDWCVRNLIVDNPDYYKKLEAGRSVRNVPKRIQLFTRLGGMLGIPFGWSDVLWEKGLLDDSCITVDFSPIRTRQYESHTELLDYQESAVCALLDAKNGILESPCGSGKTTMGMELIKRLGCKVLWITHTSELLAQSMNVAKATFGDSGMGTITNGKIDAGERITFATVQTLSNIDLQKMKTEWDAVIVDECHRVGGTPTQITMFYNVLSNLCARYKFGLTATPFRGDGLTVCMNSMLGPVVHTVIRSDVSQLVCPVKVRRVPFDMDLPSMSVIGTDGTLNYVKLINAVCEDEVRNAYLTNLIIWYAKMGSTVLVLSERVAHLKLLMESSGYGKMIRSGKKREGDNVMYATYALLSEGFDKPDLDVLIMASPIKNERTVTQSCGRVARKSPGKEYGLIVDIRDSYGVFRGYGKERDRIYKKLGYENEE